MPQKLLKELQEMFADASRTDMWGTIEISFQNGSPVTIKQTRTKKVEQENNSYHHASKPAR
jgi:IS1 family transposase